MLKAIVFVGLGGATGSILRYVSTLLSERIFFVKFPWGTLIVNTLGCLIAGVLMGVLTRHYLNDSNLKLLLVTGFCGGFTTFSAFSTESLNMFIAGNTWQGIAYIGASILIGLLAVWGGLLLAR